MVDTLRLGVFVTIRGGLAALEARGWTITEVRAVDSPPRLSARLMTSDRIDARVWELEQGVWMALETSLPRLAHGENASLLTDWESIESGARIMVASVEAAAGQPLPPLEAWTVRRIDAVWAWQYPAAPYLSALVLASVPRCTPAAYPSGMRWALPGGGVFGRAYDKAKESGSAVELPLRVERQARPKKNVVKVDGVQLASPWACWDGAAALGMVRDMLAQVGLDKPVRTPAAVRARLVEVHGQRRGVNVYRAMLEAREAGGWQGMGADPQARRRYQRMAAKAGIVGLSDVELPPLSVPA